MKTKKEDSAILKVAF